MKLTFIDPADLPVITCPHSQVHGYYTSNDGEQSGLPSGLWIGSVHSRPAGGTRISPNRADGYTFHHAECRECGTDLTHDYVIS